MGVNPEAWLVVSTLGSAIHSGESTLENVPGLLKRLLREGMWREFTTPRKELVRHERFIDFLTTPPTQGLGTSYEVVHRLLQDDTEARDLLDQAVQRKHGGERSPDSKIDNIQDAPAGTSADAALRRLRKDRPDLHAQVLADELSPHAAMVVAGFRPRTCTIRLDDPARAAATLRRQFSPKDRAELARLLVEDT